jgi:Transcriptional regulator
MKVSKAQGLLYMYDLLCKNKEFTREEIMEKLDIPPLTFHRYVQELKAFLANFMDCEILYYSRTDGKYKLVER